MFSLCWAHSVRDRGGFGYCTFNGGSNGWCRWAAALKKYLIVAQSLLHYSILSELGKCSCDVV